MNSEQEIERIAKLIRTLQRLEEAVVATIKAPPKTPIPEVYINAFKEDSQ